METNENENDREKENECRGTYNNFIIWLKLKIVETESCHSIWKFHSENFSFAETNEQNEGTETKKYVAKFLVSS